MIYLGTVENGVVVLEDGTMLPDGTARACRAAAQRRNRRAEREDDPCFA